MTSVRHGRESRGGKVRGPNSTEEARHVSVIPINFVFSSISIFVICLFRLLANARLVYGSIADYTYYPFHYAGLIINEILNEAVLILAQLD